MNRNKLTGFKPIGKVSLYHCLFLLSLFACTNTSRSAESEDFLLPVKKYADALIESGRDEYGLTFSPLFASTLNRFTLKLPQDGEVEEIEGVRVRDRSISGANMIYDIDLFKILYELSEYTGEKEYAEEADKAIGYFFNHCQSPVTGLMCWGEHLYWDFFDDDCGYAPDYDFHEATKWPFWDQSYKLAPDASWKFVIGEWDHQINDKSTGDFSRHGRYSKHETFSGFDFPRYAGQMIERWADAYNRPENAARPRKEEFPHYIQVLFNRMQENSKLSASGYLIAGRSSQGDHVNLVWLKSNLKLARCLEAAAPSMNPELAKQMREFALKQDLDFLNTPHKLDSLGGGFAVTLHAQTGLPRSRSMNKPYSSTWSSGYGYGTHASVANICYERYQSLKIEHADLAQQYKNMVLQVAEKYLTASPDTTILLKPKEFADVTELMLNAYELSQEKKYLDRSVFFAQSGIDLFLRDGSPLLKATNQHNHYESITGGPAFMYQLLKLHQTLRNFEILSKDSSYVELKKNIY